MSLLLKLLHDGAPVSYVLMVGFVIATYLFFHRFFYLHRVTIDTEGYLLGLRNNLRHMDGAKKIEAIDICDEAGSPVTAVAKAIISCNSCEVPVMRQAADEAAAVEIPRLQRNARLISVIGQLAPFMGLLGTVMNLIQEFQNLSTGINALSLSFSSLSQHIGSALINTGLGIGLAMVVILYNAILEERAQSIVQDMEKTAGDVIAILSTHQNVAGELNADLLRTHEGNI